MSRRTLVDLPLDGVGIVDALEGLLPGQNLPQHDGPAENVAFLCVLGALEDLGCHPSGTAAIVRHHGGLVGHRSEIADLQIAPLVGQQQVQRLNIAMDQGFRRHGVQIGQALKRKTTCKGN